MPEIDLCNIDPMNEFRFYGTTIVFENHNGQHIEGVLARITDFGNEVEIIHDDCPVYGERVPSNSIIEIIHIKDELNI